MAQVKADGFDATATAAADGYQIIITEEVTRPAGTDPFSTTDTSIKKLIRGTEEEVFFIRERDEVEAAAAAQINDVLMAQMGAFTPSMTDEQLAQTANNIGDNNDMENAILALYLSAMLIGNNAGAAQLAEMDLSVDESEAMAAAQERAYLLAAQWAGKIDDTSRARALAIVQAWTGSGRTYEELRAELELSVFNEERAQMIATTEGTRGFDDGITAVAAVALAFVAVQMQYYTMRDEKVCPICLPADGKRRSIGGSYPDGISIPPQHPRCRCGEVIVI
jgi:hypothetical protein